jgi:hypothetical protein
MYKIDDIKYYKNQTICDRQEVKQPKQIKFIEVQINNENPKSNLLKNKYFRKAKFR